MSKFNSNVVDRGTVLMNPDTTKVYVLIRESRPVQDFCGRKMFSYNLLNTETGKVRRTDNATPFGTDPMGVAALERAFGMPLVAVTDLKTIGRKIREAAANAVLPTVKAAKAMGQIVRDLSPFRTCRSVYALR